MLAYLYEVLKQSKSTEGADLAAQQVKTLRGMPLFQTTAGSNLAPVSIPGKQWIIAQILGSLPPVWVTPMEFLISAWSRLGCCRLLSHELVDGRSVSPCLYR